LNTDFGIKAGGQDGKISPVWRGGYLWEEEDKWRG
jgi:hypothetical protein